MARSKKLKENGQTIYPVTIWNAVVDPTTGMTLKQLVAELTDALNRIDASTLQGHGIVTAGELDPKNKIPVVGNDGVMEIGRYLDFHMDGSKEDYNIRLRCDTTGKYQHYLPAKTGTVALTSDIPDITPSVVVNMGTANVSGGEVSFGSHTGLQSYISSYWKAGATSLPEVYLRYTANGETCFVKVVSQGFTGSGKNGYMKVFFENGGNYIPEILLPGTLYIEAGDLSSCVYFAIDTSSLAGAYPG